MTFPKPNTPARPDAQDIHFGPFRLRSDGALFRQMSEVRLPPKELQLLRLFVASAGRIVSAGHLRQSLWGEVYVSPDSLPRCVSSLRAHLGIQDCIQTVYKRGYRFTIPTTLPSPTRRLEQVRPVPHENLHLLPASLPRLAVLPLLSGKEVPLDLGTEVAEATILQLSRLRTPAASLLARDSVFALAAGGATALETGLALNAHLALAGSVTALPTHLRIRVEMIRIADAVQLWIEDFLVPRTALLAETEAARRIVTAICSRSTIHCIPEDASAPDSEEIRNEIRRRA